MYFVIGIFELWHDHPLEILIKVGAENENFTKDLSKGCGEDGRHAHIKDPGAEQYLRALYQDWIMENLNRGNPQPVPNSYSIRLVLRWDIYRITFAIMLPVLLSIVAGVMYQQLTEDVQTAWTIALYAVTAVGVVAALLGFHTALVPA
ncbi:hypothetical protein QBC34DRAFT_442697 [Podospora aff. communis PSN243]|uniref:Uncharacterized protein n=1 Tax=Podospora aff. communis PSN243 TaxID=3040156 RepID=A0AAV9G9W6_9PEZI|nr:hypothetical protein QBC34DRAFT_442697 [Podospora aff. communis PSN243]